MKTLGLMFTALALTAGCSKDNANTNQAQACGLGTTCDAKVTADTAAAYYKQFDYKVDGDCQAAPTALRFVWIGSMNRLVVAKNADGTEVVAELNLYLKDDGTYTGEYQENVQKLTEPGFWQNVSVQNKKDLAGTWSTSDKSIVVSSLGTGNPSILRNLPAVDFKVDGTTLNTALNGQSLSLAPIRSKISKEMKTISQFCTDGH